MNSELQAQLSNILAQITTSVTQVADFSVSQLPDIAQQYITYGVWSNVASAVFCLILVILSGLALYKALPKLGSYRDDWAFAVFFLGILIVIISLLVLYDSIHNLILVLTAPKVWFILEIKNLIS